MQHTKIEWALNPDGTPGYSFNPITGCLNNCTYCYARKLANTRLKERYLANQNYAYDDKGYLFNNHSLYSARNDPFYPRLWPDKLSIPFQRQEKGRGIFVCDMSDLFGIGIPEEWTWGVLAAIKCHPKDRFYLLTKQPQNLIKFSPFPSNVWLGVSATNQKQFDEAVKYLKKVEATVKFISFEPLLERIKVDL